MKTIIILSAAILAAGCTSSGRPEPGAPIQTSAAQQQAAVTAELSGRAAGSPQHCIRARDLGGNKAYGRDVIVFRDPTNDVVYVNRPPGGCPGLEFGRAIKTRTPANELCRGDEIFVVGPVSGAELGNCTLGEFTPYRRAP